jgi:hypothetical protein
VKAPTVNAVAKVDDKDGIINAQLHGTAKRLANKNPLDVEAAIKELQEIAGGRTDLMAHTAGLLIGARPPRAEEIHMWPRQAVAGCLLIAAGADLTKIEEWIATGLC